MNTFAVGAAVALLLHTLTPPMLAPRVEAFALVDTAAGVPAAGYLLTHRPCVTDPPVRPAPSRRYPFSNVFTDAMTRHTDFPFTMTPFLCSHCPDTNSYMFGGPAPTPAYAAPYTSLLMRNAMPWTGMAAIWSGTADSFDAWYELNELTIRGLTLSGDPAEFAALLRDCRASRRTAVRDYGRSLARLADD